MTSLETWIQSKNFINNQWIEGNSTRTIEVKDKYSGQHLASIHHCSEDQLEECIKSSLAGFATFKTWSAGKKARHLNVLSSLLEQNKEVFRDLIIREAGKPYNYAKIEIDRAISTVQFAERECYQQNGEIVPIDYGSGEGKTALTRKFPIGVILGITPFNFPLNLLIHKVAPALASGCSIIIKPSPHTPLTANAFAELIRKAGYPEGVVNIVHCDNDNASKMVRDNRISMLSFTGSDKVGWHLKSIAAKKRVTLELGGNAAVIVDEGSDLKRIARTIVNGAFLYSGQICISTQRVIILENIYDDLISLFRKEIQDLRCGDPSDKHTTVGPLIDHNSLLRIDEWVKEALKQGAQLVCGGNILDQKTNLYAPTLIENANTDMKIMNREAFGPVAVLQKAKDFKEALAMANDSDYGLQTGVFTNNLKHVKLAHEQLEVGAVIINSVPGFRMDNMPYGGIKDSGIGKEGIKYAMEEMTETRLLIY